MGGSARGTPRRAPMVGTGGSLGAGGIRSLKDPLYIVRSIVLSSFCAQNTWDLA